MQLYPVTKTLSQYPEMFEAPIACFMPRTCQSMVIVRELFALSFVFRTPLISVPSVRYNFLT